jgi:hypothetical protein
MCGTAGGTIGEFVNPKYKDATKTAFKSSTRLECMMQDYPKALPAGAKVGFIAINQVCFWGSQGRGDSHRLATHNSAESTRLPGARGRQ